MLLKPLGNTAKDKQQLNQEVMSSKPNMGKGAEAGNAEAERKPVPFSYEDGVLTIPIYEDKDISSIHYDDVRGFTVKYLEVTEGWDGRHKTGSEREITNDEIMELEDSPLRLIQLHLPDPCEIEDFLPRRVKSDFTLSFDREFLVSESNEEEILEYLKHWTRTYLNRPFYADYNDACENGLPHDIVILVNLLSKWCGEKYEIFGYEVKSVSPVIYETGEKRLLIHMQRNKNTNGLR